MLTAMRNPVLSGVCATLGGVFLWAGVAAADVTSDRAAAILVFPKLIFSSFTDSIVSEFGQVIDTEIQLTNTSDQQVNLRCFYVNANSHCTNFPDRVCNTHADCNLFEVGGICQPGWIEVDFEITLSPRQPLVWNLSTGEFSLPCAPGTPGAANCPPGFPNLGSIPGANEDPFMGELKCVQVGPDNRPVDRNDVKGEATIVTVAPPVDPQPRILGPVLDARSYNAVGIRAIPGAVDDDNTLRIGEEYNACPNILILDHFFDDAVEPVNGNYVKTHLTLVPCSENFELQDDALFTTTVQFLVYNEFEQRFSSSRPVRCFKEFELCEMGTGRARPFIDEPDKYDPEYGSCQRSVFSAFVNGTLTGQTRIRGVDGGDEGHGNGLLGVAEEFHRSDKFDLRTIVGTAAFDLHQAGTRQRVDIMQLPGAP